MNRNVFLIAFILATIAWATTINVGAQTAAGRDDYMNLAIGAENKGYIEVNRLLISVVDKTADKPAKTFAEGYASFVKENYDDAFSNFEKAAKKELPLAMCFLGICYEEGYGVAPDIMKANEYYDMAAQAGSAMAYYKLGLCYLEGKGREKNLVAAANSFEYAANEGDRYSQLLLATCYFYGTGVKKNEKKGLELMEAAARQGFDEAQLQLGKLYYLGLFVNRDYKEAAGLFQDAMGRGNIEAQVELAKCYLYGYGVEKDTPKAIDLLERGVDKKNGKALAMLGVCYKNGIGVNPDMVKAKQLFQQSADMYDDEGLYQLAKCYYDDKDYTRAVTLLNSSVDRNNPFAMTLLGKCYENGLGVEKDGNMAVILYSKASNRGIDEATNAFGDIYFEGKAVKQDYTKAMNAYKKAADRKDPEGMNNLGICYLRGFGVQKDEKKAANLFANSAKLDYHKAKLNIAHCFHNGWGVEKDDKKALAFYAETAKSGDPEAINWLGTCFENGIGMEQPDPVNAFKLYQKAAKLNNVNALYNMGAMLYKGDVINQDVETGLKAIVKAAGMGDPNANAFLGIIYYNRESFDHAFKFLSNCNGTTNGEALFDLAKCYEKGEGTTKDDKKWWTILNQSADLQYPPALHMVGCAYDEGTYVEENNETAMKYYLKAAELGYVHSMNHLAIMNEMEGNNGIRNLMEARKWYLKAVQTDPAFTKVLDNLTDLNNKLRPIEFLLGRIPEDDSQILQFPDLPDILWLMQYNTLPFGGSGISNKLEAMGYLSDGTTKEDNTSFQVWFKNCTLNSNKKIAGVSGGTASCIWVVNDMTWEKVGIRIYVASKEAAAQLVYRLLCKGFEQRQTTGSEHLHFALKYDNGTEDNVTVTNENSLWKFYIAPNK